MSYAIFFLIILRLSTSTLFPLPTFFLFFFNDTATTEIYTLSLHDALPIFLLVDDLAASTNHLLLASARVQQKLGLPLYRSYFVIVNKVGRCFDKAAQHTEKDRKSTRLNSSHTVISYAVFCLKKKKHTTEPQSHSELVCRLLLEKKEITTGRLWGGHYRSSPDGSSPTTGRVRSGADRPQSPRPHAAPSIDLLTAMLIVLPLLPRTEYPSALFFLHICVHWFFFNDTAPAEIYTLSLHDALPIFLEEPASPLHSPSSLVCRLPL